MAPSAAGLGLDGSVLAGFGGVRVVEVGPIASIGEAHAAGIRAARAPLVALVEEHVCLEPAWAEALVEAHRGPWDVVGPAVRNANPGSLISWADLLIAYSAWLDPSRAGPVRHLPGHNSCYKREVLLNYGDELGARLDAETLLHWELRQRGAGAYLEPRAVIRHLNFERVPAWARTMFYAGRSFAASRGRMWPVARRALHAAGAPLIPLVRFVRVVGHLARRWPLAGLPVLCLPAVCFGLAVSAAGECCGYALGAGDARRKLAIYEFHRRHHVRSLAPSGSENHRDS